MIGQKVKPDTPSHTRGTRRGETWVRVAPEPGREDKTATARSSTGINPKSHSPIDPRMPHLPPA